MSLLWQPGTCAESLERKGTSMNNNRIHVYPGRSQRLRVYDVGLTLSTASPEERCWHDKVLALPSKGETLAGLSAPACRIVNAVLTRIGGSVEVFIHGSEIYLVRDEKAPWDEVDTAMLSLIKEALWPRQAVEMWDEKEFRP